jgi:hypothetical protein
MMKWIVLVGIAAMAALGVTLSKTMATLPLDGAPHQAQMSFAHAAASRCSKGGASRACRPAPQRAEKKSARRILLPRIIVGIGF